MQLYAEMQISYDFISSVFMSLSATFLSFTVVILGQVGCRYELQDVRHFRAAGLASGEVPRRGPRR